MNIEVRVLYPTETKTVNFTDHVNAWSVFKRLGRNQIVEYINNDKLKEAHTRSEFAWSTTKENDYEIAFIKSIANGSSILPRDKLN